MWLAKHFFSSEKIHDSFALSLMKLNIVLLIYSPPLYQLIHWEHWSVCARVEIRQLKSNNLIIKINRIIFHIPHPWFERKDTALFIVSAFKLRHMSYGPLLLKNQFDSQSVLYLNCCFFLKRVKKDLIVCWD